MDIRIQELLGINKGATFVNTDIYSNIELKSTRGLIPNNDINTVLDLKTQFNTERQSCTYYRLLGKINTLIGNPLFNIMGDNSLEIFNTPNFLDVNPAKSNQQITYNQSLSNNLKEIDGWYGYFNTGLTVYSVCQFNDMEPKRERFSFLPDYTNDIINGTINWYLTITYPYTSDTTNFLVNGGLFIATSTNVIVGGRTMTGLYVPVFHNLSMGDSVQLVNTSNDGVYEVKRVGLDDGSYKNNFFCLDITGLTVENNSSMLKIYDNVPSTYYFRKFKPVMTKSGNQVQISDYEINKLAFSENIFADEITQFIFNEEIDVNGLYDNLNRPLSQLYLTTVKNTSNNIFSNLSSGIEAPFIDVFNSSLGYLSGLTIIQKIHNVDNTVWTNVNPSFAALENNVLINNSDFYGDVVEYNPMTVNEVILSDVQYRFNTINRESTSGTTAGGPRPEGYYYKAHNLITIREFGSVIEQGTTATTVNIPNYAENLGDGRYLWRDLLDIGYVDIAQPVLNYPFLNNSHYIYQNYDIVVKRQDPHDQWGLYYSIFPADPIGQITTTNFQINKADPAC